MNSAYPIPGVAAVIFNERNEVCLVQRNQPPSAGTWTFPGGKLELGEGIIEGLQREIREECNLEIQVLSPHQPLCVVERMDLECPEFPHHYIILDYLCVYAGGKLKASSDVCDARWVPYEQIRSFTSNTKTLDVAQMAWRKLQRL